MLKLFKKEKFEADGARGKPKSAVPIDNNKIAILNY
jgi:hypothetical protein